MLRIVDSRLQQRKYIHQFVGVSVMGDSLQSASRGNFADESIKKNLYPLWEQVTLHQIGHPVPEEPCHWQWKEVQQIIDGSIRATSTSHAERRVLLMAN